MKILAAGDSFTYGQNLPDITKAYPYLVGKKFGAEVINTGQPGLSNPGIMREVIDNFDDTIDLVIIGLTNPGRIELADQYGYYSVWPGQISRINQDLQHQIGHRAESSKFISLYHNDEWLLSNFYRIVLALESFLLQRGKPFLFYCIENYNDYYFKNYSEITKHYKPKFLSSYSQLIFNHTETMSYWMGYNKLSCDHPNEIGHQLIAENVYEHCRNICGLS